MFLALAGILSMLVIKKVIIETYLPEKHEIELLYFFSFRH